MDDKIKILLCEDDENLGMLLREYLQAKGFVAELCADGEAGFKAFLKTKFDICVLDVMMPKKDGFTLAQEIRSANTDVPIIFLTAKTLKEDILEGFKLGADDYITKPFSMEELVFRIEAILRRTKGKKSRESTVYRLGQFTFDTQKQLLQIGEKQTKLTTKENELLALLCSHSNEILQRDFALKTIWIDDNYFNARSMDVYITKLRKHLKDDPQIEIINIHGKGYKLITPEVDDE
ncbi:MULTISPECIES: response regulator transcription factor [Prevotellaceae]|jgi:DNA-binding response OmpR family regulator|uniref:DNA-binding repsonse regulator RprY n=3 Tax=Xylanibacter ruminicola TaxID=839 RepID=D5EYD5_XYLR2|nr:MULTISPECIES: response regulator transcription factor [Prevotellaceae]MBP3247925.1 response regulator transcription factor [Prevotella sp.]ADE81855.1 DNA-binding repsonse regulator RprY [Xylanibacter ruminicola 23]MBQ6055959.1 response regulator transcription factor [Prevotella sp.]QVJ82187.1 response regulator transcription factor [Xylanibacter ruminicola]SDQ61321.1 DNA-binding response regulator, OmpR family, contains REC and winged-helix (wHTH) domain [Prevotella sp. khp1]